MANIFLPYRPTFHSERTRFSCLARKEKTRDINIAMSGLLNNDICIRPGAIRNIFRSNSVAIKKRPRTRLNAAIERRPAGLSGKYAFAEPEHAWKRIFQVQLKVLLLETRGAAAAFLR